MSGVLCFSLQVRIPRDNSLVNSAGHEIVYGKEFNGGFITMRANGANVPKECFILPTSWTLKMVKFERSCIHEDYQIYTIERVG